MIITPKFDCVDGNFNTQKVEMICVPHDKHGRVDLCIKEPGEHWNFPIAKIQLHSKDLYVDFKATFEDAVKLGEEIARRWNESQEKR